jgi:DNA-3-methyladenine glycosylase
MKKLDRTFFSQHVVTVAQNLLGKILTFGPYQGIITETEAYRGADDPASHAFRGRTPRSSIMFGPPGFSYVYFIYGKYYCLNIVTEPEGEPSAVLIRGLRLFQPTSFPLTGPGKLCQHLGITTAHNGINLAAQEDFCILDGAPVQTIQTSPRIGIKSALDKYWRFWVHSE